MKLEVSLYASGLKNVAGAMLGKSDPFAVVTNIATTPGSKPQVIGKTEVCQNTLNPEWTTTFFVDYQLGQPLSLAVSVFDHETKGDNKPMGSAVFDVASVLGARGNTKAKRLKNGGTLFAHVSKVQGQGVLRLRLKGVNLKNVEGLIGKSDPFFELSRRVNSAGAATWDNVYRSKTVENTLNPTWDDATMELSTLCNGDLNQPIRIQVFDYESKGKHVNMGELETTVNKLVAASPDGHDQRPFTLQVKGKDVGHIEVVKALVAGHSSSSSSTAGDVTQKMAAMSVQDKAAVAATAASSNKPNFVDYVSGGCELNVVVAIDFTGSNGNPKTPGTLHYLGGGKSQPNDYQKAIRAIVNVLSKYDSDQKFPVLGFGAKYNGVVQQCFQCGPTQEAHGVQGVLDAYTAVFESGLIMSSPTVFTEVIERAAARANSAQEAASKQKNGQAYTILLIVTDGAVSDPNATASVLQKVAPSAPLSLVIVGVGNADFSSMEFLDDHGAAAAAAGTNRNDKQRRDIAQFVQFNKHCANSVDLTSTTLKEIPDQLVAYFTSKNIAPLPPIQVKAGEIIVEEEEEEIDLRLDLGSGGEEEEIVVAGGGVNFVNGFSA
jgi:hypothetical protein